MVTNNPFTIEDFNRLVNKLIKVESKEIQLNQKEYDLLVEKLGCEPCNVRINNYLPDNQGLMYDLESCQFDYKIIKSHKP